MCISPWPSARRRAAPRGCAASTWDREARAQDSRRRTPASAVSGPSGGLHVAPRLFLGAGRLRLAGLGLLGGGFLALGLVGGEHLLLDQRDRAAGLLDRRLGRAVAWLTVSASLALISPAPSRRTPSSARRTMPAATARRHPPACRHRGAWRPPPPAGAEVDLVEVSCGRHLLKPRLGRRRCSGIWPPSKPPRRRRNGRSGPCRRGRPSCRCRSRCRGRCAPAPCASRACP